MPSSIDIAPAVGHAVLATQLGVGATPGYDAIDFRRGMQVGAQEGVHDAAGWKVTEHSPNALTVDVAANVGLATVQGDTITAQGRYVVPPDAQVDSLTISTANVTNPRLDQILLHVYDTTVDGLGANKSSLEVLTGTPTAGATLANRNGAAALPPTALLLADVLVAANATVVTNSVIRDRRRWAYGVNWAGVRTQGTLSTSSGAVAADTTHLQARLECTGTPLLMTCNANENSGSNGLIWMDVDGAQPADVGEGISSSGGSIAGFVVVTTAVASGSHLFTLMYGSGTGTYSVYATAGNPLNATVREIVAPTGNNGIA